MKVEISFREINRLAIPAIISGISEPLLSITDTAIVGRIPEEGLESLAAAGIVGSFLSMLVWVLGQTRSSISAIVSQYLGAGKLEEVRNLPMQAIFFNFLLSLFVIATTLPFASQIFQLFDASGRLLDLSLSYYSIRIWGLPLTLFTYALFGVFRGLQNTFHPMWIAMLGTGVNIGLDFVLVYGIEGWIPAMNLEGAAYASLIAQAVMALAVLLLALGRKDISLRLEWPLNPEILRLLTMSANLFVRTLALNAALLISVREATSLGKSVIAAHTVAMNLWLFAAFFIDGYSAAGNSMGGRLLGALDFKGLWDLTRRILLYGSAMAAILLAIGIAFLHRIGNLFTREEAVLEVFDQIMPILLLQLPVSALTFVLDGLFKGMGEMKYLRNILLLATFACYLPALIVGKYFDLGIYSIWIALSLWMLARGGALWWRFRSHYLPKARLNP